MELLVTLDENYLAPLETMLCSLSVNDPGTPVRLWLIHGGMPEEALVRIRRFCQGLGWDFRPCKAPEELFAQAPVPRYYSTAMYYRLLASRILPDTLDRVIYLDPDTLILNPISPLERLDLEGNLFAAAAHTAFSQLTDPVNRVRLHSDSPINGYFNSGVLVMDLAAQRRELDPEDIFRYATDHAAELILPDQDLLNALYGSRVLPLDDSVYNYDARQFPQYLLLSGGEKTMEWVMDHTAVLHFCGRSKPWKPNALGRFVALYQHYAHLARRCTASLPQR